MVKVTITIGNRKNCYLIPSIIGGTELAAYFMRVSMPEGRSLLSCRLYHEIIFIVFEESQRVRIRHCYA
jgi:hypothetical protein